MERREFRLFRTSAREGSWEGLGVRRENTEEERPGPSPLGSLIFLFVSLVFSSRVTLAV